MEQDLRTTGLEPVQSEVRLGTNARALGWSWGGGGAHRDGGHDNDDDIVISGPWLLPSFCFSLLFLSPWRPSGLSLLVKCVIAHPGDTGKDALAPASLSVSDPEEELRAPFLIPAGNRAVSMFQHQSPSNLWLLP